MRRMATYSIISIIMNSERNTGFYKTYYVTGRHVGPPSLSERRVLPRGKAIRCDPFQVLMV